MKLAFWRNGRSEKAAAEPPPAEEDADTYISGDAPIRLPEQDGLGFPALAEYLAEGVQRLKPNGFVVAIHGKWGSGKSSLLYLIEHYLNKLPNPPLLVYFNPWWFGGQDLTRRFLAELGSRLGGSQQGTLNVLDELADILSSSSTIGGRIAGRGLSRSAEDAKNDLEGRLKAFDRRIVIIIDDIDRLTKDEVRRLFQVIKSVGNLPKVTYLLAFDREYVAEALEEVHGDEFVEKIVQFAFDLPKADKAGLRAILLENLDAMKEEWPPGHFDQTHFGNLFLSGVEHMMVHPRDVVRLVNGLAMLYPKIAGEVDFADFVAIEAIRQNFPALYYTIRENPDNFTGRGADHDSQVERARITAFHQGWLDRLDEKDKEPIKELMERMFPRLQSVWGNSSYSHGFEGEWRRERRICSEGVFPVYFQMAVPTGVISNSEILTFLSLVPDTALMAEELVRLAGEAAADGGSKAKALLANLEDYTERTIPIEQIPSIIEALLLAGDALLPEDEQPGVWIRTAIQIDRVIYQLSLRLSPDQRHGVFLKALQSSESITVACYLLGLIADLNGEGRRPAQEAERQIVDAERYKELREIVLQRIRNAAEQGTLIDVPELSYVLHRWYEWAEENEPGAWLTEVMKDDAKALKILEAFGGYSTSQYISDRVGRKRYRLNPKSFSRFTDLAALAERVRQLPQDQLAVKTYLKGWDALERGVDPDSPFFDWDDDS